MYNFEKKIKKVVLPLLNISKNYQPYLRLTRPVGLGYQMTRVGALAALRGAHTCFLISKANVVVGRSTVRHTPALLTPSTFQLMGLGFRVFNPKP